MQSLFYDVRGPDKAETRPERPTAVRPGISLAIYFHDFSPGGVERQCLALARALPAKGVDVVLVVHQMRGELLPLLPTDVRVVDLNSGRTLQDVWRLRRFLLDHRPDVLMANVDHNNVAAALAKAVARTGTKLVICQHNPLTAGFHATVNWKHRLIPALYRILAPTIDHAVAVSPGIAQELVASGLPAAKVSTIFNAVIGDDFASRANVQVLHPWLIRKDRPVFVTAGRLVEMKDHRTLLRAFAMHVRERAGRLMILGTGPMLPALRALAASLGIAEHVAFEGFVPNPLPYMRAADAFVLSSRSEGFGNVLVEAMGCGTPVVSTACPHGPAEILEHGKYGILVAPQDPKALGPALGRILDDHACWPAERLRARAAEFSSDACANGYATMLRELVA